MQSESTESMPHVFSFISRLPVYLLALWLLAFPGPSLAADEPYFLLGSTSSTYDSGLLSFLLPRFQAATNIEARPIVQGTGQILKLAKRGDLDVVLVHHQPSEEEFVAAGFGLERIEVMRNDFILIGPKDDPASVKNAPSIIEALQRIMESGAPFFSRGDDSGTHKRERLFWDALGVEPRSWSGAWYRETGSGMGATLNSAASFGGYLLSDRATWISFANKQGLVALHQGDPMFENPYGIILVNPKLHPHVKAAEGEAFISWLRSPSGRAAISAFKVDGKQLFFPTREQPTDARN